MKNFGKQILLGGMLCGALISGGAAADGDYSKVVRASDGQVVRSALFGTCVRTQWEASNDVCAPEVPAKPAQVVKTRTVLSSDEQAVYFAFDKAELTADAKTKLNAVSEKLKQGDDVRSAKIIGHTDRIGQKDYNMKLSLKRAKAVQEYLASRGYLKTEVTTVAGMGPLQPITHCPKQKSMNSEIACLAPDRRVDIGINYVETEQVVSQR